MGLLEALTVCLGPALAKAVLKLWLPEKSLVLAAGDGIVDILKKRGEDFATADATERLFRNLTSEVAERLKKTIEIEFPRLQESDCCAAVLAVANVFQRLDLSRALMTADLNAVGLEQIARPHAKMLFVNLGGEAELLAQLVLRETCAYTVMLAGKLPDFQVTATRELLKRTSELIADLSQVLDVVNSIRGQVRREGPSSGFETQYRRVLSQRLDRMQLFGVRLVGAGAREPEISVAYVTLTSTHQKGSQSGDVDTSLAGLTRVVVRGEAGSGKTTLLHWLGIRAARRDFERPLELWNALTPVFVRLRDFADESFPPPERLVASIAPNLAALTPPGWAHDQLSRGALVLIDGIDEVPVVRRGELLEWLRSMIEDFPQSLFVISSRPAALDAKESAGTTAEQLARIGFEQITLEPMSLSDSEALVSQWHQAVGRDLVDEEEIATLDRYERELIGVLRDRSAIRSLASNPLLCSMICVLNWDRQQRLPENRMQLYGYALEMLIDARDADRKIRAANLAQIDWAAKEALLDGIAYWMMRNGATEADRADVENQIAMLLQRLTKVPRSASEVLQELLERSGVLRQPQFGIIDFIHRTFLEYMAARAAVAAGDIGFLAEKARDDSWRETIVFAAGHAQGKQRDQLITKLLRRSLFSIHGRSVEKDVTAACCLETAGANLAPPLLRGLRDCAKNLFPPLTAEAARLLAPAALLDPSLLRGHESAGQAAVAACIRCAALIGGNSMLEIVESYANCSGGRVWLALLEAWLSFDDETYFNRVLRKRKSHDLGTLDISTIDKDSVRCLRFISQKGRYQREGGGLKEAMKEFVEDRTLRIPTELERHMLMTSERHSLRMGERLRAIFARDFDLNESVTPETLRANTSEADAFAIVMMKSTRRLNLGSCDRGVIKKIVSLPALEGLAFVASELSEIDELQRCENLRDVSIGLDNLSMKRYNGTFGERE